MNTPYDVLQVSRNADIETIKAAYKSLVQRHHPDKNPDSPNAENKLKDINRAYEILSNPVKRAEYDSALIEDEGLTPSRNDRGDFSSGVTATGNDPKLRNRSLAFFDLIPGAASIQLSEWLFHGSPLALGLSIAIGGGLTVSLCHSTRTRLIENVKTRTSAVFLSLSISLGISLALITTTTLLRAKDGEKATLSSNQFDPSTAVLVPTPQDLSPTVVPDIVNQSPVTPISVTPIDSNATMQYIRGLKYKNGVGVPQDDTQAAQWFRLAAQQGHARAQSNLGVMYGNGEGVPQDYAQAMVWFRKAADQGDAYAQANIGFMYDTGQGIQKDDAQATEWYLKAADHGSTAAQFILGFKYANGQGVPQDDAQAAHWYSKAADQGHVTAQFNLGVWAAEWIFPMPILEV